MHGIPGAAIPTFKPLSAMTPASRRPRSNDFRYADERLRFVIRASGLHTALFARRIGVCAETLYGMLHAGAPMTPEIVGRIHAHYPQIDPVWLLCGPQR